MCQSCSRRARSMLRLVLLVLLTHRTPAYVTEAPSFADRLERMSEKLEKFAIPSHDRQLDPSPDDLLSKIDILNSLGPEDKDLTDEDEELLSMMQQWGTLTPEQLEGVAKELQEIKGDEKSEKLVTDGEYSDPEWGDELTNEELDYAMDNAAEEGLGWDDLEVDSTTAKPVVVTPSAFTKLGLRVGDKSSEDMLGGRVRDRNSEDALLGARVKDKSSQDAFLGARVKDRSSEDTLLGARVRDRSSEDALLGGRVRDTSSEDALLGGRVRDRSSEDALLGVTVKDNSLALSVGDRTDGVNSLDFNVGDNSEDISPNDAGMVSAVDPIAATNERPRILDDSTLTDLERSAVRAAAIEHMKAVREHGKCLTPQPRWLSVAHMAPAADIVYMPPSVQLHRCAHDTACCPKSGEVCAPVEGKYTTIAFVLHKPNKKMTFARMLFYNHTRCACVSRSTLQSQVTEVHSASLRREAARDTARETREQREERTWKPTEEPRYVPRDEVATAPPQMRRCTCPGLFLAKTSDKESCACVCEWADLAKRRDCLSLARGREHFGLRDRVCVVNGDCQPPACEYGAYDRGRGQCPHRFRRQRYYRSRMPKFV